MSNILNTLLSLSIGGSIVALVLFVAEPLFNTRLSKKMQYCLWLLVLLRLIIPISFNIDSPIRVIDKNIEYIKPAIHITQTDKSVVETDNKGITIKQDKGFETIESNTILDINREDGLKKDYGIINDKLLFAIWITVCICYILFNLIAYSRYNRKIIESYSPINSMDKEYITKILKYNKSIMVSDEVDSPIVMGIFNHTIVIPNTSYTKEQLKNIILHETTHINNRDIIVRWASMIVNATHWFNPLVYIIRKKIILISELACDESVIREFSIKEKQSYGDTLIAVASNKVNKSILQAGMSGDKSGLKKRLTSILNHSKKSKGIMITSVVILILFTIMSLCLGPGASERKLAPPNLYISQKDDKDKIATLGSYDWAYKNKKIHQDNDILDFRYEEDNIAYYSEVAKIEVLMESVRNDEVNDFVIENVIIYNEDRIQIDKSHVVRSLNSNKIFLDVPNDIGKYFYQIDIDFGSNRNVTYGFMVVIEHINYDIKAISSYRTPYIGNSAKVINLVSYLPVPYQDFMQKYISLETDNMPYELNIYYESIFKENLQIEDRGLTNKSKVYRICESNSIVLFSMIDNLDKINYYFRLDKSDGELKEEEYKSVISIDRERVEGVYGKLEFADDYDNLNKKIKSFWEE